MRLIFFAYLPPFRNYVFYVNSKFLQFTFISECVIHLTLRVDVQYNKKKKKIT